MSMFVCLFKYYFTTGNNLVLTAFVQTEEYMDSFDFEMAGLFCQRALDVDPNNLQALDMQGHICSELGDTQKAKGISYHFLCCFSYK